MKGFLELGVLLVSAAVTSASPLKLGKNGPVVQADGATSNIDKNIFRPVQARNSIDDTSGGRAFTRSRFSIMRRRIEMFLAPFPHGCTWPMDAPRKLQPTTEETAVSTDNRDEDFVIKSPELKRRERRFEHALLNILPRQVSEVTVTTTTTMKVSAQVAEVKTVTATATATETIGATVGEGAMSNGTEAVTTSADGDVSTTRPAGAEASNPPVGESASVSTSASAPVEGRPNEQASATSSPSAEASMSSTRAGVDPNLPTSAASEASSSAAEQPTGSAGAPATTQTARAGIEGFQNAEGISVPLEIIGENVPKPESNSASGLPLTQDANQPIPTTAGADLPAPTLSPGRGAGSGTLIQPDELPGQAPAPAPNDQSPPKDNQTPPENRNPGDQGTAQASSTLNESQAPIETASSATGRSPDIAEGVSNGGQPEAQQNKQPDSDRQGPGIGDANGAMVNKLTPDDVLMLLDSAPPKRVMKREEMDAWASLEGRIAARRSEQRQTGGFQTRRLRGSKIVF